MNSPIVVRDVIDSATGLVKSSSDQSFRSDPSRGEPINCLKQSYLLTEGRGGCRTGEDQLQAASDESRSIQRAVLVNIRDDSQSLELHLPQLLTADEAAVYLGVSAYTIRERLKSGDLPGCKHGARWLIRVVDLSQYVEPNNVR